MTGILGGIDQAVAGTIGTDNTGMLSLAKASRIANAQAIYQQQQNMAAQYNTAYAQAMKSAAIKAPDTKVEYIVLTKDMLCGIPISDIYTLYSNYYNGTKFVYGDDTTLYLGGLPHHSGIAIYKSSIEEDKAYKGMYDDNIVCIKILTSISTGAENVNIMFKVMDSLAIKWEMAYDGTLVSATNNINEDNYRKILIESITMRKMVVSHA